MQTCLLAPQHYEAVFEALKGYDQGIKVVVHGISCYNRLEKLQSFETIEHINILDKLDIATRLEVLAQLQNGWLDGKGVALDKEGLEWLTGSFDFLYNSILPLPYLFPTPEGAVQAEWSFNEWEITLEINLENKNAEYQAVNVLTGSTVDKILNLAENDSWVTLNTNLSTIIKEGV